MSIAFKKSPAKYMVGQPVNQEHDNYITGVATANTAFGIPVVATGTGEQVAPLTAAAQNIVGITIAENFLGHAADRYQQYDIMTIAEDTVVAVLLGANVTRGAQARFNTADGTWTGASASATVLTVPGAQFDEAGTSGGLVALRYRRPIPSLSAST